jgi:hypothetical protein
VDGGLLNNNRTNFGDIGIRSQLVQAELDAAGLLGIQPHQHNGWAIEILYEYTVGRPYIRGIARQADWEANLALGRLEGSFTGQIED